MGAFATRGFAILGYPEAPKSSPAWAKRAERVHLNLLENLPPFTALVIIAEFAKADPTATAMWASVFLFARLLHWLVFILNILVLRTLTFVAGFVAQLMIFLQIMEATNFALPALPF